MDHIVRTGYVSSINYDSGTVRIYYPDRRETTSELPYFSFNGEYKMPQIEDMVLVLHISNDTSSGVVLGKFWGSRDQPPQNGEGVYFKSFEGSACEQANDTEYVLCADNIKFQCGGESITVAELIQMREYLKSLEQEVL